jgi:photosystem II stability/assembly factor-like uncharacterized protein
VIAANGTMKIKSFTLLALLAFSTLDLQFSTARAQGTAFSYQGQLQNNSQPANGTYDFFFTLYSTNLTGVPIAGPVTNTAIAVSNGLFSTSIDFGNTYSGESNWLEIAVSTNQANVFAILPPRQQLFPVPYAITAANLSGAVSSAQLPASVITNGASGVNVSGTFNGNGSGLTSLPIAVVTNMETGVTLSGTFSGNGSSLTSLPPAVVTNTETGVTLSGTFSGNGSGITNVPGAIPWQAVSGTGQTVTANQAYLLTNNTETSLSLPFSANIGDIVTVSDSVTNWNVDYGLPGATWTAQNSGNQTWYSVASSSDGTHLVAVALNGSIYTSTDSGVTWTAQYSGTQYWYSVASSSDGTHLVAAAYGDQTAYGGQIYTSTNSGVTWTAQNSGTQDWDSVASSSDGSKLVAVANDSPIYTSTNSGVTWTAQNSGTQYWQSVASSSDGTHLVAVAYNGLNGFGLIGTSTNSGMTWTAQNIDYQYWDSVASSSDGTKLVAAANGGQIYTSTNSGVTWTAQNSGTQDWQSVASSSDGTKLVAVANNSPIYTSTNSGVTWTAQNSGTQYWYSVASSSDGAKLVAGVYGGPIYTSDRSSFSGLAGTTAQFQYIGNNQWQPLGQFASQIISATNIIGTISAAQLPSSVVTNTEVGVTLSGTFSGNGSGLTSLPAAVVTNTEAGVTLSGTFNGNGSGLTNVALLNASQTFNGQNNFTNLVGIGTTSPLTELHVRGAGDTEISVESIQGGLAGPSRAVARTHWA